MTELQDSENAGEAAATEAARIPSAELKSILEALIFASPEPLTPKQMYKVLDTEPKEDVRGSAAYKKDVVRVFVQRGLKTAVARAKEGRR